MHRFAPVFVVALAACSTATPEPGDVVFAEAAIPGQAAPPAFVVGDVVRSEPVALSGTGLAPGMKLFFVVSAGGPGAGPCFPELNNNCLNVIAPWWMIGTATVQANGTGTLNLNVPATLPYANVAFQAVAFMGPTYIGKSPVVIRTVQDPLEDTFVEVGGDTYDTDAVDTDVAGVLTMDQVSPGDLVISEVMVSSAACPGTAGQYLAVTNLVPQGVDLAGLRLTYGGQTFTVPTSTEVALGEEFVLWLDAGSPHCYFPNAFGVPYTGVTLATTGAVSIASSSAVLDVVDLSSLPHTAGVAAELSGASMDVVSNDSGANWCPAPDPIPGSTDLGSPAAFNVACP